MIDSEAIHEMHAAGMSVERIAAIARLKVRKVERILTPYIGTANHAQVDVLDTQAAGRWRCHCGRLASGVACGAGHDAPWIAIDRRIAA